MAFATSVFSVTTFSLVAIFWSVCRACLFSDDGIDSDSEAVTMVTCSEVAASSTLTSPDVCKARC